MITVSSPLDERLHAFEVVCKIAIQLRSGASVGRGMKGKGLGDLGALEFGLTKKEANYCIGRATNWLWDIREADRARNKLTVLKAA